MAFFKARPEPRAPQALSGERPAWSRPDHGVLGGFVPLRLELARTDESVVLLGPMEAFASGVKLSLIARCRTRDLLGVASTGGPELRFGVEFADGRSAESSHASWPSRASADGLGLVPSGATGTMYEWRQGFWLWPLPAEGLVRFHVLWGAAGISERSVAVEAAVFVSAAAGEELLWPPLTRDEELRQSDELIRRASARSSGMTLRSIPSSPGSDQEPPRT